MNEALLYRLIDGRYFDPYLELIGIHSPTHILLMRDIHTNKRYYYMRGNLMPTNKMANKFLNDVFENN